VGIAIEGEETRRTYSLVNAPGESPLRIVPRVHVMGRMSRYSGGAAAPGDLLDVLAPNGSFTTARGLAPLPGPMWRLRPAVPSRGASRWCARCSRGARRGSSFSTATGGTSRAMCLEEPAGAQGPLPRETGAAISDESRAAGSQLYNGRLDAARVRQFAARCFRPARREYFVCGRR